MTARRAALDALADLVASLNRGAEVTATELLDDGAVLDVGFRYLDPSGSVRGARARMVLPEDLLARPGSRLPLVLCAGYELPVEAMTRQAKRGACLVTPLLDELGAVPELHPLCRGPNLDVALLHLARALPFVDAARVILTGGSAGGYQALLLAAESFPVAAVLVDAPVLDLGHVVASFRSHAQLLAASSAPVLELVLPLGDLVASRLGDQGDDETLWRRSPLAHVDAITAQVSLLHSTADLLVPVGPLGVCAQPAAPPGLAFAPVERASLLARLHSDEVFVQRLRPAEDAPRATADVVLGERTCEPSELVVPWSPARWTVSVVEEGSPQLDGSHFAHVLDLVRPWDQTLHRLHLPLAPQLTTAKLELLMRRLAGREWLGGPGTLDVAAHERADVLLGLRLLCAEAGGAAHLESLYRELPADLRMLGPCPVLGATTRRRSRTARRA